MIQRHSPKTDSVFSEQVDSYVPANWKLWALVFKAIAEGHYDSLHAPLDEAEVELLDDVSFGSSIDALYQETCCKVRLEIPSSFRGLDYEERQKLQIVAGDIIDSFNAAKPLLPDDCPEIKRFETVVRNCRFVVSLGNVDRDWKEGLFPRCEYEFFGRAMLEAMHKLANGVCIEEIDYETFVHALECDGEVCYDRWLDIQTVDIGDEVFQFPGKVETVLEDYSDSKIVPVAGFGMAMYALLLHLSSMRQLVGETQTAHNGISFQSRQPWEQLFQGRIDWNKNNYELENESWKDAYLSDDLDPPTYEIEQQSSDLLSMLCGRRVFRETFKSVNFEDIVDTKGDFPIGFDQYKFIHDNGDRLQSLYHLLVQETEFLYANLQKIVSCFVGKSRAEEMRRYSQWRFDEKRKNNENIHFAYSSSESIRHETVQRFLFERSGLAYDQLDGQPIIYAELVEEYIQSCIVQDERLKSEISRAQRDSSIQGTGMEHSSVAAEKKEDEKEKSKREKAEKLKKEAIQKLQDRMIIDADCNILLKKKGGKYYKTTELTNFLVLNEIVVPSNGWAAAVACLKAVTAHDYQVDGHFKEAFFRERTGLHKALGWCSRQLDWSAFKDVFCLQNEKMSALRLHHFFTNNNEERERIIIYLVKKYDGAHDGKPHKAAKR